MQLLLFRWADSALPSVLGADQKRVPVGAVGADWLRGLDRLDAHARQSHIGLGGPGRRSDLRLDPRRAVQSGPDDLLDIKAWGLGVRVPGFEYMA